MEHERIHVRPKFGDEERDVVRHQAGNETDIAAEPIELGDGDWTEFPMPASCGQGGGELRAAIERVRALARLDLDMLGDDLKVLGLGEAGDGGALGVNAEPRAALLASANPVVSDQRLGHGGDPSLPLCK